MSDEHKIESLAAPAASVDVNVSELKSIAASLNDIAAGLFNIQRMRAQQVSGLAAQLSGLIDSAGGAKVYQCPRCSTSMEVDPTAKPAPQPAEGDGAAFPSPSFSEWLAREMPVGTIIGNPYWWAPKIARAYERTRPSATAAVPEGFVLVPKKATPEMLAAARMVAGSHGLEAAWDDMLAAAPAAPKGGVVDEPARALVAKIEAIHADPRYQSVWVLAHNHGVPYTGPKYDTELAALTAALANQDPRHDALADGESASA